MYNVRTFKKDYYRCLKEFWGAVFVVRSQTWKDEQKDKRVGAAFSAVTFNFQFHITRPKAAN